MRYVSTRGEAPELAFEDVLLTGLARDGGLYVPAEWPKFSEAELSRLRGRPYADVAFAVIAKFTGSEVPPADLEAMIVDAYRSFGHPAVTPLKQLDADQWLLELFHGPTLAFKDVAMQFLARVMDWALARRKLRATIVGATSGDTGGAAIEAFRTSRHASIFILHPEGKVSEVQRRQMTTVLSPAVHNIALRGTFDDCQAILKALFNDHQFRDAVTLAGVNSINWARIMAQVVYYVTSALVLGTAGRPVNFTVPTGNFGDIFAGLVAKRMGAPIGRLIIATNENDILDRALRSGRYEVKGVRPSTSPSMDIQVSSNFERLLFEAYGRDAGAIRRLMASLGQSGAFTIEAGPLDAIRAEFASGHADMAETANVIAATLAATGELVDPHTAVGLGVARKQQEHGGPMVTLATAHPAKFPDAVERASGRRPGLPPRLAPLMMAEERVSVLANDPEEVKAFILKRVGS
ncbi:MAG: threonine synthase [Parvibaculaceae bacterium]